MRIYIHDKIIISDVNRLTDMINRAEKVGKKRRLVCTRAHTHTHTPRTPQFSAAAEKVLRRSRPPRCPSLRNYCPLLHLFCRRDPVCSGRFWLARCGSPLFLFIYAVQRVQYTRRSATFAGCKGKQ